MNELRIGRMSANAAGWPKPNEVPGMLRHIADDRMERALREQQLPDGEWCLRRLDVDVELDPERPLTALETDWADRIVTALRQSLRDGSRDVVRYLRPEQAVDDLLSGLATRQFEHDWAWRQVGLLQSGDPEPRADARGLFLLVLGRLPQGPAGALARLVRRIGLAPIHRLLGRGGWMRAAALAIPNAGAEWLLADEPDGVDLPTVDIPKGEATGRTATDRSFGHLAAVIASTGILATAYRNSGLRVDAPTVRAWAVLAVADRDPSLLHRRAAALRVLVGEVADRLQPQPGHALGARAPAESSDAPPVFARGGTEATGLPPARSGSEPAGRSPLEAARQPDLVVREAAMAATPDPDITVEEHPAGAGTPWGGLLFLLNTAKEAGLPGLLDEPPFLARPASWVLYRLGLELVPASPDDPALLALAGLEAVPPEDPQVEAEELAIEAYAARWARVTAERLRGKERGKEEVADASGDAEIVEQLAHRQATILQEPGWVEVCLRSDDVDLEVRRAGLDLDPGWVWWLGQVIRFRYE
jgi:hypothetical protein